MNQLLHLDFETRSVADLKKVGIWNYITHATTLVLMLAFALGDGPVKLWQPHTGSMPDELNNYLQEAYDGNIRLAAYNSTFERLVFQHHLKLTFPADMWEDPMISARHLSLPGKLEDVGEILGLPVEMRKMAAEGKVLKDLFTKPIPQRIAHKSKDDALFDLGKPEITFRFNDWTTHPVEWKRFCEYCRQDVVAEREIRKRTVHFPLSSLDQAGWILDQKINDAGWPTDPEMVSNCLLLSQRAKQEAFERQKLATGLENPNSNKQMLAWVRARGYPHNSLRGDTIKSVLRDPEVQLTEECRNVLLARKESASTSYKKLEAILNQVSPDNRLRDQLLFMGSARAGRWSGGGFQPHNMARPIPELEDEENLDAAREQIKAMDFDGLALKFPSPPKGTGVINAVKTCIRSCFIAPPGKRLNVCDLNAIETRVGAWITGCKELLDVFRPTEKYPESNPMCPYLAFASKMFQVSYDTLHQDYYFSKDKAVKTAAKVKRQVAKPAVLGAIYRLSGGGWGTNKYGDRIKTGLWGYAENMGVTMDLEMAQKSVTTFRESYPEIRQAWYDLENMAMRVLRGPKKHQEFFGPNNDICFHKKTRRGAEPILCITLPSGRTLHYIDARIVTREMQGHDGPYEKATIVYSGTNIDTKKWGDVYTHGGKLLENIVQAIARDILLHAMLLADDRGFEIVGHVHDEIITLTDDDPLAPGVADLRWCMSQVPVWAPGLILNAAGYEGYYYHK